jgi:Right handed beta helix region
MHRSARFLLLGLLAALACALFVAPTACAGSVLWVDPSGSDRARGTSSRPLRTIDAALERARPGQTILVRSGVYPELVEASPRGRAGAPITLKPAPGARPVVTDGFKLIGARNVRVTGMIFDGSGDPDGFGTSIWRSQDVELSNNEITGYGSAQGILIRERSERVRVLGNHIHHLGEQQRFEHGIYCESARRTLIAGNVIHDIASGYGIHLFGDCDDTRILGNTIARNGLSGIIIAGNDTRGTADRTVIARNVIAHHETAAFSEYGFAVTEFQPGSGNVVRDNVFFMNASRTNVDCDACTARGNVERDPQFVDPEHGNFALRRGSPARAVLSGAFRRR